MDTSHARKLPSASLPGLLAALELRAAALAAWLQPAFALGLRLYVAWIFFNSGLIKLGNWTGTLALFADEFHVPLLPPAIAAVLGTACELGLPPLLAFGLAGRAAAVVLFAFNAIAVISYPGLSDAGIRDHAVWGTMLAVVALYGPGALSLDGWAARRYPPGDAGR